MRTKFSKFAQVAGIMLALTFTFSCSSNDDNGGSTEQKCGGVSYDPSDYRCETGELVGKCKGEDYYPAYQQCVGGVIVEGGSSSSVTGSGGSSSSVTGGKSSSGGGSSGPKEVASTKKSYNHKGELEYEVQYEYDSNGNLIRELQHNHSTSTTASKGYKYKTYYYDSKGNQIKKLSCDDYYHTFELEEYEYDSKGNKIKETEYKRITLNTCADYANMTIDVDIDYINEYEYDSKGNVIKQITYRDGSTDYEIKSTWSNDGSIMTFNFDGCIIEETYITINSKKLVKSYKSKCFYYDYMYEYDAKGNMTKMTKETSEGNTEVTTYEYTYITI